jgi:hypothetical protein
MAVYLWMRYSYVWAVTPSDLLDYGPENFAGLEEWYVSMSCQLAPTRDRFTYSPQPLAGTRFRYGEDEGNPVLLGFAFGSALPVSSEQTSFTGRISFIHWPSSSEAYVDTTASRFHPASVAGLVVAAMSCFVFASALRHWASQRTASE